MGKIWEHNLGYTLFRPYVDWCTRTSFSKVTVSGRENIPTDGAVLLAPNHCNTLMDALLVLQADHGPSGYGARADIFKKPFLGAALRWLRIVPLARQRDGMAAVAGNEETFEEIVECLDKGVPFCMFCEGTHRPKHSLLPLKKGIWRIATRAAAKLDKPVYIVPVGLDYDDYFRYMKNARVTFGEPIRVYADSSQQEVMELLKQRLSGLFTYFPDDENYEQNVINWENKRKKHYNPFQQTLRVIIAILTLPLFLLFAVMCCPMWIAAAIMGGKLKDKAWLNTIRYLTKFALMPFLALLLGIPAFIFLKWYWALLLLFLLLISHSGFYYLQDFYRNLFQNI